VRIGIFHVNGSGDQLIAWPTLRALRKVLPGEFELWLALGMQGALYRDVDPATLGRVKWVDKPNLVVDIAVMPEDRKPLDLFVSVSDWGSPSVVEIGKRLGASRTVGIAGPFDELAPAEPVCHMFDRLFSVARHFDPSLTLESFASPPRFSRAAQGAAVRFVGQHLEPGERMLFVHPETKADKMWTRQGFEFVLTRFLDRHEDVRVFLTSNEPYPLTLGAHQDRLVWVDQHFELAMEIARYANLFLGIDSCFLHAADLYRTPAVGLFGKTDPVDWGFRFSRRSRALWTEGKPIVGLAPEAVLEALEAVEAER